MPADRCSLSRGLTDVKFLGSRKGEVVAYAWLGIELAVPVSWNMPVGPSVGATGGTSSKPSPSLISERWSWKVLNSAVLLF